MPKLGMIATPNWVQQKNVGFGSVPGMGNRLRELRESRGWTIEEAAEKFGLSRSGYVKIERGDRGLKERYILAAAEVFGVPPAAIIADKAEPALGPAVARSGTAPPFGGFPQAGSWAAVDEYFQQDVYDVPEFVLRHPSYAKVRQYAYQVRGNSMDRAGIEDGMWVVAADALEFVDKYRETESGDLVVVERTRFQGAERELTIKEVRYYRDRMELLPRSSDPDFKPIIVPIKGDADDGVEVKIIGVVLTSYRDHMSRG